MARVKEISFFKSDELVPASIGIIFDTSGSMVDKIDGVQDAVKHFIDTTKQSDEIFLIRFSNDVRLVCDFTDQKPRLRKAIDSLEANCSTALYDAIYEGLQKVRQGKNKKKAILLITEMGMTPQAKPATGKPWRWLKVRGSHLLSRHWTRRARLI